MELDELNAPRYWIDDQGRCVREGAQPRPNDRRLSRAQLIAWRSAGRAIGESATYAEHELPVEEHDRYHLTNRQPITMSFEEGDFAVGEGWVVVSERELERLAEKAWMYDELK